MLGKPIEIVVFDNSKLRFNEKALGELLLDERVANRKVAVICVSGPCRHGKSFLLNFMLRYLGANCADSWLDAADEALRGFQWRADADAVTKGILMWSQPFIVTHNGEEIAVLLMDTEGSYGSFTSTQDWVLVFILSSVIASLQIYNKKKFLAQSDFQQLQYFVEYGRLMSGLASESGSSEGNEAAPSGDEARPKPFQQLLFLVRDWQYPFEQPYGHDGGQLYLQELFKKQGDAEVLEVRQAIEDTFDNLSCFLMPYPGKTVATSKCFDGKLSDIDSEFMTHLKEFVPLTLRPDNLEIKTINGKQLTGRQLFEFFKVYAKRFETADTVPTPQSLFDATAEGHNMMALSEAKEQYFYAMSQLTNGPYMDADTLRRRHEEQRQLAMDKFRQLPKMGSFDEEICGRFEKQLLETIDTELFGTFRERNKGNLTWMTKARTPLVLLLLSVAFMIVGSLLMMFNLRLVSSVADLLMLVCLVGVLVWTCWALLDFYRPSPAGAAASPLDSAIVRLDRLAAFFWQFASRRLAAVVERPVGQNGVAGGAPPAAGRQRKAKAH